MKPIVTACLKGRARLGPCGFWSPFDQLGYPQEINRALCQRVRKAMRPHTERVHDMIKSSQNAASVWLDGVMP